MTRGSELTHRHSCRFCSGSGQAPIWSDFPRVCKPVVFAVCCAVVPLSEKGDQTFTPLSASFPYPLLLRISWFWVPGLFCRVLIHFTIPYPKVGLGPGFAETLGARLGCMSVQNGPYICLIFCRLGGIILGQDPTQRNGLLGPGQGLRNSRHGRSPPRPAGPQSPS